MDTNRTPPKILEFLKSEAVQKLMKPITPADVEEAIKIDRRLLKRRRFNEETYKSEYHPPLTPEERWAMVDAYYIMRFPLDLPERTYMDSTKPNQKDWIRAVDKVYAYFGSELYVRAGMDAVRASRHEAQTKGEEQRGTPPPTA